MRIHKKVVLLFVIVMTSLVTTFSQELSEVEKQKIIYGDSAKISQVESSNGQLVTKVVNADMYDYIFNVLKDNLWFVIVICVLVVVILYSIIGLLMFILKSIGKRFDDSEYIEFGKLKIKNKNYKKHDQSSNQNVQVFDVDKFLSILELLMESEISNSISRTIEITNNINMVDSNFKKQCENIFRTSFNTIKNEYYTELLTYIIGITGFSSLDIHKTKEYFFINDFLQTVYNMWVEYTTDIISRNGFVEIVNDRHKSDSYIEELNSIIWQSIDLKKMEVTSIVKKDFDSIIESVSKSTKETMESMFIRVGKLKQSVLEKKEEKMKMIEDDVKESTYKLLYEIKNRFLKPSSINQQQIEDTSNEN